MTYALFGYIERVGKQAGQFVSQGQPRMAVCLEFRVAPDRYRVTRSTPSARGPTKVLLERWEGDGWRQAGEGADRVREADAQIRRAIGLDYGAFTRTVLLPQGRFAEFLVGDAKDRRAILTELLGLELFEHLAKRAGEVKRDATAAVEMNERLLETEYAGVTPEALAGAEQVATQLHDREVELAAGEGEVRAFAERWNEIARSVRELRACGVDVRQASQAAAAAAGELARLAEDIAEGDARAKAAAEAAAVAAERAREAAAALTEAEHAWGRAKDLTAVRARAEGLAEAGAHAAEVEADLDLTRRKVPALAEALEAATRAITRAAADAEASVGALATAKAAVDAATHADLVAAVRAGIKVGDACPVCGNAVASLPRRRGAQTLERATAAHAKAEAAASSASDALVAARAAGERAERELREVERDEKRVGTELAKMRAALTKTEEQLAGAFGGTLPPDPVGVVDERLERLEELSVARDETVAAVAAASDGAVAAERARDALGAKVGELRGRLAGLAISGLLERARSLGGDDIAVPDLAGVEGSEPAPRDLADEAAALADRLGSLAERLDDLAAARADAEGDLIDGALSVVPGLEPRDTLAALVEAVSRARTDAAREAATAEHRADELRAKLEHSRAIADEVAEKRGRAERFAALAAELRADRITAFLQLEALEVLAAGGSERLSTLSSGRYRLAYADDEFYVVDTWNGEERRSARTLSGGETFLASLALALALSEQVRSLSVTEKARLDSLFLDEGFGTLDPETLEVVVDAIEQLGGDGRMVGVITHVQELAIRLPARVEVEKSPRGSRLHLVT
jgi:exonuclease SbcC